MGPLENLCFSLPRTLETINWSMFKEYLSTKYSKVVYYQYYSYAFKYQDYLQNVSKIQDLPISIKSNVLKSLIALAKYLGIYEEFTKSFKAYGIKWINTDSFNGFLNFINGHHEDLIQWFKATQNLLADNERIFLKFTLISGLRKNEAIKAFNKVIDLSNSNTLDLYYNSETQILEHFKFTSEFLHKTKNCYISVVSLDMIKQIQNSKPIYYTTIRKHLTKNKLKIRIKELRSYNNSYLRKHGILAEYIDILSGRIPKSVFARHYLKETLAVLSSQILPIQEQILGSVS
jgi:intergrase/recombinase